jgi:hypothetical protein
MRAASLFIQIQLPTTLPDFEDTPKKQMAKQKPQGTMKPHSVCSRSACALLSRRYFIALLNMLWLAYQACRVDLGG